MPTQLVTVGSKIYFDGFFYKYNPSTGEQELTTPAVYTLIIQTPDGIETTYADATAIAAGHVQREFVTTQQGAHAWRWKSTSGVIAASEGTFTVGQSLFATP